MVLGRMLEIGERFYVRPKKIRVVVGAALQG
jgi:hypothetical protein